VGFYFFGVSIGDVTWQLVGGDFSVQHRENHTPSKRQMVVTIQTEMKALSLWNNFSPGRLRATVQLTHYPVKSQFLLGHLNCLQVLGGGECFSVGYVLY
jgi:hypothetical protein